MQYHEVQQITLLAVQTAHEHRRLRITDPDKRPPHWDKLPADEQQRQIDGAKDIVIFALPHIVARHFRAEAAAHDSAGPDEHEAIFHAAQLRRLADSYEYSAAPVIPPDPTN